MQQQPDHDPVRRESAGVPAATGGATPGLDTNRPYDLVAFDLDGTILDNGETIVPDCIAAIRRVRDLGVRCVINSGRGIEFQVDLLDRLGLLDCFDALIGDEHWVRLVRTSLTDDGRPDDGRPDDGRPDDGRPEDGAAGPAGRLVSLEPWNSAVARGWTELEPLAARWYRRLTEYAEGRGWRMQGTSREDSARRGMAAVWLETDDQTRQMLGWLEPQLTGGPLAANSNGGYIHLYDQRYDKGTALLAVAEHFAIPPGRVLAFGDNINDRPMLDGRHGFGAATVANAKEVVRHWVHDAGGLLADRPSGGGVADLLTMIINSAPAVEPVG